LSHILTDVSEGVMTLTLNRPEKKNALTVEMYHRLADGLVQADRADDVRVVVLLAAGDSFTVGNDIGDFARFNQASGTQDGLSGVQRFLEGLARLKTPLVAGVRGHAVGLGTTLLLHCDLVYVAQDARLATPFVDLGLAPEAASSLLLPARIGHVRAFQTLVLGQPISGSQAAEWGLANAALPAAEVDAAARAAAQALAVRPHASVLASRALLKSADAVLQRMAEENVVFAERLRSPEAQAAFRAFAERGRVAAT
jgi:enoyl-CoA hydratase/carnithine racemase